MGKLKVEERWGWTPEYSRRREEVLEGIAQAWQGEGRFLLETEDIHGGGGVVKEEVGFERVYDRFSMTGNREEPEGVLEKKRQFNRWLMSYLLALGWEEHPLLMPNPEDVF